MEQQLSLNGTKLRKSLSSWDLFLISFSGMVGSGWLFGVLAGPSFAGPAAIITWVVAGLFFIVLALLFSELGAMLPKSGSLVRFNEYSHGPASNFKLGWAYLIGAVATPPIEAAALTSLISSYISGLYNSSSALLTVKGVIVSMALLAIFIAIQYVGVNIFGKTNAVMTWFKIAAIILTIIFGIAFIFNAKNFFSLPGGFLPYHTSSIFVAMVPAGVVFSYEGFRQGIDYAGEVKNPQKSIPIAMISGVIAAMTVYIVLQVIFIGGINWERAGIGTASWSSLENSKWSANPFFYAFSSTGNPVLIGFAIFLVIAAVISSAATLGVFSGTSGRSFYGMSRMNYIPGLFGQIHPKFQTPTISMIFTFIIGALFLLPFPSWYALVGINASFTVYAYLGAGITNIVMRKTIPDTARPFRTPLASILAPAGFIIASLLVYFSGWSTVSVLLLIVNGGLPLFILSPSGKKTFNLPLKSSLSFSIIYWIIFIVLGIIFALSLLPFPYYWLIFSLTIFISPFWLLFKSSGVTKKVINAFFWIVAYDIILGVVSYYGSLGVNTIIFPYDYILFAVLSGLIYLFAIKTGYHTERVKDMLTDKNILEE